MAVLLRRHGPRLRQRVTDAWQRQARAMPGRTGLQVITTLQRVQQPAAMAGMAYSEQVTAASGDVERAEISIAKGAVGRPVHRHGMRLQDAA